ncbi:hypothetical protein LMG7974_01483 [Campylobacter majalis]|uniref:Outer membrane liproprotein n=1 Tax=Campylobacter majalis TaxID=2790656 RepID=A0ABN7KBG5_9BACT|nr:hypothetical protein [Campylobacter majalis]CAD7289364.1 hypothetical protein LMG7974_01483 [Campylobacter majalis]
MRYCYIFGLILIFLLSGCVGRQYSYESGYNATSQDRVLYTQVLKTKVDCSDCSRFFGKEVFINGRYYTGDVALKCCLSKNLIDTDIGLKKVYIHRVVDRRKDAKGISYTSKYGKKWLYDTRPSIEALFVMFLQDELKSRGILVVDTQTSPYTYKLDFDINSFVADYVYGDRILNGRMYGGLRISNINFKRELEISTKQQVRELRATQAKDFDFFVALLAKQAANKVAQVIASF